MGDLRGALAALLDRELAEHEEAAGRSARADVRCLDCNLRYDERKEYGCVIEGTAHSYDEGSLNEAAERARREPREYVTLSVAEVRAVLAEHPPAALPTTQVVGTTEPVDWIADPSTTAAEKVARFQALEPTPTRGPADAPAVDGPSYGDYWPPADLPVATGDAGTYRDGVVDAAAVVAGAPDGTFTKSAFRTRLEDAVLALATSAAGSSPEDAGDIETLVERSSLGTPEAAALRATVSDERAAQIVARAKELEDAGEHDCTTCTDCIHEGRRCCGCYDGACCKEDAGERVEQEAAALREQVKRG